VAANSSTERAVEESNASIRHLAVDSLGPRTKKLHREHRTERRTLAGAAARRIPALKERGRTGRVPCRRCTPLKPPASPRGSRGALLFAN
jgi:hypothetical protein